jgi:hypothetical protein
VAEVLNRNEDLRVGVQQVKALLGAFSNHSVELLQKLKVTGDYKCLWRGCLSELDRAAECSG